MPDHYNDRYIMLSARGGQHSVRPVILGRLCRRVHVKLVHARRCALEMTPLTSLPETANRHAIAWKGKFPAMLDKLRLRLNAIFDRGLGT